MASSVEYSARINHHTRRVNFAGNYALSFNLDAALSENHAIETAGNHYPVALDLSFDLCPFAQNHGLFGDDVPFYVAVNAERPGDSECPIEVHTLLNEASPFFVVSAALCYAGPLPRHDDPQERLFPL